MAHALLEGLPSSGMVLADKAYDATEIRTITSLRGGWANIPPRRNRRGPICFNPTSTIIETTLNGFSTG
ncbi:hypothetical protein IWQ51_005786 [Labrenzia sp. EL_142]|nr:hypothetical protein [Labrenzia sp. EL_142]